MAESEGNARLWLVAALIVVSVGAAIVSRQAAGGDRQHERQEAPRNRAGVADAP